MNRAAIVRSGAIAGIAGALPRVARAQTPPVLPVVRVGAVPSDTYAQAYYGDEAGIFKAHGIAVEIHALANSGAIAAAIAGGSIDAGVGSPSQIAQAILKGLPFTFFAPGAYFSADAPTTVLMVAKSSPLQKAADLNGKTVGVDNLGSIGQLSIAAWLQKNGGDPKSIKYVELPFSAMAAALEAGRVDAGVIAEPALAAARPTTRQLGNPLEAIGKLWFISAWFTTRGWIEQNPSLAKRFAQAIAATSVWCNAHQRETAPMLEKASKMQHEVVAAMTRARFGETFDPALVEPLLQLAVKNGLLSAPVGAREIIAPGFADTAR